MKTCPQCQADIPDDRRLCANCETPLGPIPILLLLIAIVFGGILAYTRSGDQLSVSLGLRPLPAGPHRVVLHGTANLPDGFRLLAEIDGLDLDFATRQTVVVRHGSFRSQVFDLYGVEPSAFIARVSASNPRTQPRSVQAVIGDNFERLVGPFIGTSPRGPQIWGTRGFRINHSGDVLGSGEVLGPDPREQRRVLGALREWLGLESAFRPGCSRGATEAQVALRNKLRERALFYSRDLVHRSAAVPKPMGGLLRNASRELAGCISCSNSAIKSCDEIRRNLKKATQLARGL